MARWWLPFGLLFVRLPTGFLPDEDQGVAFAQVQTPPGATQGRTQIVLDDVANYLLQPGKRARSRAHSR